MRLRRIVLLLAALSLALPRSARADDVRIDTIEHGDWPSAVAALQVDLNSEGSVIHIVVKDDVGRRLSCGTYSLTLDAAGSSAFATGLCDEVSSATALRLIRRTALFDHDGPVAKPRAPRITATRITVGSSAGGAKAGAGSFVSCSAVVRPYLDDLEKGTHVALHPGRYGLRVMVDGFDVSELADAWRISTSAGRSASVAYTVFDIARHEDVVHGEVSLSCTGGSERSGESSQIAPEPTLVTKDTPTLVGSGWKGTATTVSLLSGVSVLRSGSQPYTNGIDTADASIFGLRDFSAPFIGLNIAYERTGIYSSLGAHFAWVDLGDKGLISFGANSTVAGALHFGDTSVYLGPNAFIGAYQLTGVAGVNWTSHPIFGLGVASGVRVHLRSDDKAWVVGGEIVAPVVGTQPWFFTVSLGWGGAS